MIQTLHLKFQWRLGNQRQGEAKVNSKYWQETEAVPTCYLQESWRLHGDPPVQGGHPNSSSSITFSRVSCHSTATAPLSQDWDGTACRMHLQQCVLCDRDSGAKACSSHSPRKRSESCHSWQHTFVCHFSAVQSSRSVVPDSLRPHESSHRPNPFMTNREQTVWPSRVLPAPAASEPCSAARWRAWAARRPPLGTRAQPSWRYAA